MHPLHELRNANTVANYRENYQTLIKNGTANGAASDTYPMFLLKNQVHHYEVHNRNPVQPKSMQYGLSIL
jgi:hypothetical protein